MFDQLAAQPSENWYAILERSQPATFNPRGTDTNFALLKSSLDDACRRIPNPDFVLFPGDLMAHEWQKKYDAVAKQSHSEDALAYRAFTSKAIRFLTQQFRQRYPKAPILPTLGNDDSFCGDYMITPDGPFLKMFAETWAPLLQSPEESGSFDTTFSRGGYYTIRIPRMKRHRLVVLNSVLFSVNYNNACGASTSAAAIDQLRWMDQTLEKARASDESVWLLMHIPPGINAYNSADSVPNGGPPVTFWQPELTSEFLRLANRHSTTLDAGFFGHTHMDDFRSIRLSDTRSLPCKIAPAVSPIFGNNPCYQIYQYDRTAGTLQNYQAYYLTNLATNGKPTSPSDGVWALEYDFRKAYGFPAFDSQSIATLFERLKSNVEVQQQYTRFYSVSAAPDFTPQTLDLYRCAIANMTPSGFLMCLTKSPEPRSPTHLPDRKRTAVLSPQR